MAWPAAETCLNPPSQKYRRKWRGSSWKPFMWADRRGVFPNAAGAEAARRTPERPGIYEFAISRTRTSRTKHTVYVGMSKNLRQRHMTYVRNGSHIADFIEHALRHGNVLWRRILVLGSEQDAQQEEMKCQTVLDYPWNKDQNPNNRRYVYTRQSGGLFGGKELVIRSERTGQTTAVGV